MEQYSARYNMICSYIKKSKKINFSNNVDSLLCFLIEIIDHTLPGGHDFPCKASEVKMRNLPSAQYFVEYQKKAQPVIFAFPEILL